MYVHVIAVLEEMWNIYLSVSVLMYCAHIVFYYVVTSIKKRKKKCPDPDHTFGLLSKYSNISFKEQASSDKMIAIMTIEKRELMHPN